MKSFASLLWRATELGAWFAGLALMGTVSIAAISGEVERRRALASFARGRATGPAAAQPDQTLWSQSRIDAYQESLEVAPGAPLGVLSIPRIRLRVPIYEGASALNMNRGVGKVDGTDQPGSGGNLGIAGHRDGYFRGLKDLALGDAIHVESLAETRSYHVVALDIVEPDQADVLDPTGRESVTLVTCYPFYFVGSAPRRYIVRAVSMAP